MTKKQSPKYKIDFIRNKYGLLSAEIRGLFARMFCKRKIIIISEKGISSVPISSKTQFMAILVVLSVLLWISYSTGKYVTYESVISQKDREIWNTNVTNEGLQYQMADLHHNLADLNKYFENIKQLDQVSQKGAFRYKNPKDSSEPIVADNYSAGKKDGAINSNANSDMYGGGIQQILYNIREKVLQRISSLENIIEVTGIDVARVADYNSTLKTAYRNTVHLREVSVKSGSSKNQGGPYNPIDDTTLFFNQDEFESEINYLMQLEKVVNGMPIASPMKHYSLSSGFGRRTDPITGILAMHSGLDVIGEYKSKIYSSAPGVVRYADLSGAYGRMVEIDHGSGITTLYGHLERILVREGEVVKRGQLIGLQGNSGRSTGTHLHYEVRVNDTPVNPINFLEAGKYVF